VYVIGGIVDRNRHKRICLERAEKAGVAHARLPIQKHLQLSTSAVRRACLLSPIRTHAHTVLVFDLSSCSL
jgi:hypothetical protein